MIRRPPRSTLDRSSAASDVYKRQVLYFVPQRLEPVSQLEVAVVAIALCCIHCAGSVSVSYTHLRAHETVLDLVCRLLLEQKQIYYSN